MANTKFEMERECARQEAIEWQNTYGETSHHMSEDADWTAYFRDLGERYDLTEEFEENGII